MGGQQLLSWVGFGHCFHSWQITEGVKPTLSELEKFEDQPEGIDLEVVTESTGKWVPLPSSPCCLRCSAVPSLSPPLPQGRNESTTSSPVTTWRCARVS